MISLVTCGGIFLSIHVLLFASSWCVREKWLENYPSLKLMAARILFLSCLVSPILVCFIKPNEKPILQKFVSLDTLSQIPLLPQVEQTSLSLPLQSLPVSTFNPSDLRMGIVLIFLVGVVIKGRSLYRDLSKIKAIMEGAIVHCSRGRLRVLVSDGCLVPFSFHLRGLAYVVLPIYILSSATEMKIALAHEGQHHRQGDCLWAHFFEAIRTIFWGNPGIKRWYRIFSELQELACDEELVGHHTLSAHDYGRCLFKVAQTASDSSQSNYRNFACTVGMTLNNGNCNESFLIRRIFMLSKYRFPSSWNTFVGIAFTAFAITAPLCSAYAGRGLFSEDSSHDIDLSSINPKLQQIANREIVEAVKRYKAKSGAIAVVDPSSGKLLAFAEAGKAGLPSWKTRIFPAASTIKPFVAAAAINAGTTSEDKVYDCHSPYYVDGIPYTNSEQNTSEFSLTEAVAQSVNVCLIKVAQELGSSQFRAKLADFGFDTESAWNTTGSDAVKLANAAESFTITSSLDNLAKAFAVLANKGHLFSSSAEPVISETTSASVSRMLVEAVEYGTGQRASISGVKVAGKTGTLSHWASGSDASSGTSSLALFAGYAPVENPRFVTVVLIEDGSIASKGNASQIGTGGTVAAPVFHKVMVKSLSEPK